jgi:S-adenosylmethionine:tRNA ribosyltransferase-isomerase
MFIRPPYQPRVADALLTDFAYPQTPVMAMTAAFCGLETIQRIYQTALKSGYMFDIFGDALLIR